MNRYQFLHVTEFHYEGPVSESYNEVRLRPIHDDFQSCLSFRLTTSPTSAVNSFRDNFGNWVYQFNILSEHRYLRIEAESIVLAHETPGATKEMPLSELDAHREEYFEDFYDFLSPTQYTPHLAELSEFVRTAEQAGDNTVWGFVQAASDLIHERFRYVKGATHVHSSIQDSLSLGAGVCQDFAHLLLAVARSRGIPARYVSGYLVPNAAADADAKLEHVVGGQASHAWAEVFVDGSGWQGLDPTLGTNVGLRHVRVAYGRDYGDVAPVRGVYKGHSGQRLSVDVRVCPALDQEGCEQLSEPAAGPSEGAEFSERRQQPVQQQ